MFLTKMLGRVRGLTIPNYADAAEPGVLPDINPRGDLCMTMSLPERSELVRNGNSWGTAIPTASAFTFVATWPTTRAELVLYNGELQGGKTYLIDRAWIANITSMGAAQPIALLGQIAQSSAQVAAATDNSSVVRWSLIGNKKNYGGKASLALANTAFALANSWFILGDGIVPSTTTNLGCSFEAFVYGRYFVPPGAALCLAGLAGTAAGTAIIGVEWHEVQFPLLG